MILNSKIFIVWLLIIEFKVHLGQETSTLQSDEKFYPKTIESTAPENSETLPEVKKTSSTDSTTIYDNNLHSKEQNAYNKSIEYLIEEPNSTNRRHEQEVIIKPLNYLQNESKNLPLLEESPQELPTKSEKLVNQSVQVQELTVEQPTIVINKVTENQTEKITKLSNNQKEVLIINLLNSENEFPVPKTNQEVTTPANEVQEVLGHINKTSEPFQKAETTDASIYDQEQQLSLNATTTENEFTEFQSKDPTEAVEEKKENVIFKPVDLIKQYTTATAEVTTTSNYDREKSIENQILDFDKEKPSTLSDPKKDKLTITEPLAQESIASINKTKDEVLNNHIEPIAAQTLTTSPTSESDSSEEQNDLTPKPIVTLEDYAVKQMDFILDHMLLESQEFVAKVLQATGNTVFQRDPLKRYAENLNSLLNPHLESDYSDEIYQPNPTLQQDIYEEVIKKINFLKSKTTKELQRYLPVNWIKEYQDKKEELKIWLNKAADEMHRVFNFHINEEEDHIKYLYFNEAFDDIARATEIHQKLTLLADLIKIVKNKKQITFMDLYMQ